MKERVQMRGHCQGCGRLQAATAGVLAHHGYTVEHGYFHGTCYGARELPLEASRELLDRNLAGAEAHAAKMEDRALKLEQREIDPKGKTVEVRGEYVGGRIGWTKVDKLIPYDELSEWDKKSCRDHAVWVARREAESLRDWARMMRELAAKVHGQPLVPVKVNDQSKVISVGDRVKVAGREVEVTKIAHKRAMGVGPGINGQYVEHVFWKNDVGQELAWPKRYARKIAKEA